MDAKKLSEKKNWGPASKGLAARLLTVEDLGPGRDGRLIERSLDFGAALVAFAATAANAAGTISGAGTLREPLAKNPNGRYMFNVRASYADETAAIVNQLNEAVGKIAGQAEVRQQWSRQGATAMVMSPAVFDKYIQDDIAKWAKVIKSANIKAE